MRTIKTTEEAYSVLKAPKENVWYYGSETALKEVLNDRRPTIISAVSEREALIRDCISADILIDPTDEIKECIKLCDRLVIYGASTLSADKFDRIIEAVISVKNDIKIICVGDLLTRITCAVNGYSSPVESAYWEKLDFVKVGFLYNQVDSEYRNALNKIRNGDFSGAEWLNANCCTTSKNWDVRICTTQSQAEEINFAAHRRRVNNTAPERMIDSRIKGTIEGDISPAELPVPMEIRYECGDPFMFAADETKIPRMYVNPIYGRVYIFGANEDVGGYIKIDGINYGFKRFTWHKRTLKVLTDEFGEKSIGYKSVAAYSHFPTLQADALSLSQTEGLNFPRIIIDPKTTMKGELAALLSRGRSASGVVLLNPIEPEDLKFDETIIEVFK